jgi:uncharacterized protein YutE (UPF0331/DUF86 family)
MSGSLSSDLDALGLYLNDLREVAPAHLEEFEQDKMLRRYCERMLHMTVDQAIRIGIRVLTDAGYRTPDNYHDVFVVLGEHGILTRVLVNSMTMMVELRNLLVYEYDVLDPVMVFGVLRRRLDDVAEFILAIRAFAEHRVYVPSPSFAHLEPE